MKYLILFSIFTFTYFTLITSCSKKHDSNGPVILPDTLTAGWTKITNLPKTDFRDIFFPDNTTGYAVGFQGIYKSTDAGNNWTQINPANYMVNIAAANASTVCFVGNGSKPYITHDGGNSFDSTSYSTPGGAVGFNDCYFSGSNTCYFSSYEYVWKSVNAGVSIDTLFHFSSRSSASLFFLNDQLGWVLRLDGVYKTEDAGSHWNLVSSISSEYGAIDFVDQDNGYLTGYGTLFKTTDGGSNWTPVLTLANEDYGDVDFVNLNEGFYSAGNRIYKTTDAGSTWTQVAALGNEKISEIHFNDASHGWACTTDGVVLRFNQ